MPLSKDSREFIECLNSNKVEYLIVGALAVSWHGFPRYSADIDFFLRASRSNAECVLRAIGQFGFGSVDITAEDLLTPGRVIQLGREPNRIDLLTSISGVALKMPGPLASKAILTDSRSRSLDERRCCAIKPQPAERKIKLISKN